MAESKNKNKKKDYAFMCKDCYFIRECPCDCKEPENPYLFEEEYTNDKLVKKTFVCSNCKHRVIIEKKLFS